MNTTEPKDVLRFYLQRGRDAVLWKLDGLSEYDVRRPLVPTGTNLLGLVKHLAGVELGYFGMVFGRPPESPPAWLAAMGDESNVDLWATADESREDIIALYRHAWEHADTTIATLDLDTVGHVFWWPEERREPTLHTVLCHVIAETQRHAGHADIVRELIDGEVGMQEGNDNMADVDQAWWADYRERLERVAREAGQG